MRRKIKSYIREASVYEKAEDRNGTDAVELGEAPGTGTDGGDRTRRIRRMRRGKNEANGDTEREEEDDEGVFVSHNSVTLHSNAVCYLICGDHDITRRNKT